MAALVTTGAPEPRASGLLPAFLVALALHLAALAGIAFYKLTPPSPPGEQQVSIDLAPLMTESETQAPTEQQQSEAAPPETKPIEEPTEAEPTRPPPDAAAVKPEEAATVPPQTQAFTEVPPDAILVEPESQVVTAIAERAEPLAPPPPVVAKAPEPEKPVEPEKPKPDPAKLKAAREARIKAVQDAKRREEVEEARREAAEERREAVREAKAKAAREARAKAAPARQGSDSRSSASSSRRNAEGRAAAGNDPSALRQWTGAISSAIHGRMNPGAASGTSGGTAMVRFTVMRSGQVTSAGLARSSGVGQIDSAALGAVRGSLPAAPAGVTQPSLSVTIPLNYRVR